MKQSKWKSIPFLLPSLLGMVVLSLLPILIAIVLSFTDWNRITSYNVCYTKLLRSGGKVNNL